MCSLYSGTNGREPRWSCGCRPSNVHSSGCCSNHGCSNSTKGKLCIHHCSALNGVHSTRISFVCNTNI